MSKLLELSERIRIESLESEIIELYTKYKYNPTEICRKLNIKSTHSIYRVLKKYNVQEDRKHINNINPGDNFWKLEAKENLGMDKNGSIVWKCLCVCGKYINVRACELKNDGRKSCGCWHLNGKKHKSWNGYEDISGHLWSDIKKSAKKRNLEFSITIEEAWEIFIKQKRKCVFTGRILTFSEVGKDYRKEVSTASLDRIDSSKGYTKDNVQWVHKVINIMKKNMTDIEFIDWCGEVYNYKNTRYY